MDGSGPKFWMGPINFLTGPKKWMGLVQNFGWVIINFFGRSKNLDGPGQTFWMDRIDLVDQILIF
jgi:hypothetical protein